MKSFIALSAFFAVSSAFAITEQHAALGEAFIQVCTKEVGASAEEISKVINPDFSNATKKMQCFANCFLEKTGFMKNGQIQTDAVTLLLSSFVGNSKVEELVNKCKDLKGVDHCETAWKIYECYHKNQDILV